MKQKAFAWYAQLEGCFLVSLGICFLGAGDLLVSGTAGISLIVNKFVPLSFGTWFFIINLPFFYLAVRQMGWTFSIRSFICITLVSLMSDVLTYFVKFEALPSALAAMIAGGLIGVGLIILFRHRSSLGGVNILALFLEERMGIHSGRVILISDLLVMAVALTVYPLEKVAYSTLGFVILSSVLGRYHRKAPIQQQQAQVVQNVEPQLAQAK